MKRGIRHTMFALLILAIILSSGCFQPELTTDNVANELKVPVVLAFDRQCEPFYGSQGKVIAEMYADKLVVLPLELSVRYKYETFNTLESNDPYLPRLTAMQKINQYFDTEASAFFRGNPLSEHFKSGSRDNFSEIVSRYYEAMGEEVMINDPLFCNWIVEPAYLDEKILSVHNMVDCCAGGVRTIIDCGTTFDLTTGEMLSLADFVSTDLETFKEEIIDIFSEMLTSYGYDKESTLEGYSSIAEYLRAFYAPYTFEDFEFCYTGERVILFLQRKEYSVQFRVEYSGEYLKVP